MSLSDTGYRSQVIAYSHRIIWIWKDTFWSTSASFCPNHTSTSASSVFPSMPPLSTLPLGRHTSQFENLRSTISTTLLNLMVTNLGHIAVNKAVFIIHNEVFEILRRKHLPLPHVAQTRLLQQLPAALEGPLSCRQLQLLVEMWSRQCRGPMTDGPDGWLRKRRGRKRKNLEKNC